MRSVGFSIGGRTFNLFRLFRFHATPIVDRYGSQVVIRFLWFGFSTRKMRRVRP